MIAAEVKTSLIEIFGGSRWREPVEEWAVADWCVEMIGPKAEFRDQVSDLYPWTYYYSNGLSTWYFAREEYATMFRLKWL